MSSDTHAALDGSDQGPIERKAGAESELTKKGRKRRRKKTVKPTVARQFTGAERVLILDCLRRSGLAVTDFAVVCGVPRETLYSWRKRFAEEGPAGLENRPRKRQGSRLPEETQRSILMLKEHHPDWGSERIHDVLLRSEGFSASPGAIQRVLKDEGYVIDAPASRAHRDKKRRFERARPNQLWQSDLFTFTLKRSNRRVQLVGFLDDHSRFVVGHMLASSSTSALVREALLSGITRFGPPEEVLTDNGPPYAAWRGKTAFSRLLQQRGIAHVRSRPRHPQTLGKIERFWQSLWQECLVEASLRDLDEARELVSTFIDRYNFLRPHQGIDGLVPADRFFGVASTVREALEHRARQRVAQSEGESAPLYLTGRIGAQSVSLHGEGDKLILVGDDGERREVSLADRGETPGDGASEPASAEPELELAEADSQPELALETTEAEADNPRPAAVDAARVLPADAATRPEQEAELEPELVLEFPDADPEEPPGRLPAEPDPGPGESPLDQVMHDLRGLFGEERSQ